MITANVIHRVFRIQWGAGQGTAFAIDVGGKQYLVTARHVISEFLGQAAISVFSNGTWLQLPMQLVGHGEGDVDVSVVAPSRHLTPPGLPMEPMSDGLVYGQDVYFLGFPYDFLGKFVFGDDGWPLPFVKKATVSLLDGDTFLLDGHNNPGFSGGPVVFVQSAGGPFRVAAVVSGYQVVPQPVYAGHEETAFTYDYNTGIIVTHAIDAALKLIEQNPIGLPLEGAA